MLTFLEGFVLGKISGKANSSINTLAKSSLRQKPTAADRLPSPRDKKISIYLVSTSSTTQSPVIPAFRVNHMKLTVNS